MKVQLGKSIDKVFDPPPPPPTGFKELSMLGGIGEGRGGPFLTEPRTLRKVNQDLKPPLGIGLSLVLTVGRGGGINILFFGKVYISNLRRLQVTLCLTSTHPSWTWGWVMTIMANWLIVLCLAEILEDMVTR